MALPAQTRALRLALVAVALFGVLLVAHLALQQSVNNFALGCSGLAGGDVTAGGALAAPDSGCAEVTNSAWATVFGIPQTFLGLLFYGLMALLRLAYVVQRDDRLRLGAFALAGVGAAYSAWLVVVQATQIGAFCALCLLSAGTAATLLLLHVIEHRRLRSVADAPPRPARREPTGMAALRPYLPLLGLFVVLLAATVVHARAGAERVAEADASTAAPGTAPLPGATAGAAPGAAPGTTPAAAETPYDPSACAFDPAIAPIADTSPFTSGPFKGTAGAPVEIIEIFDPNCPHCKDLMQILHPVVEANLERVRFYPVAYPLRPQSVGQVAALTLAQREGKYFELVDEMMRRQDATWGMTLPEIEAAVQAVGMNPQTVAATLQDQARVQPLLEMIQAQAASVGSAFATADGSISVPKLAINGRVVQASYASYTDRCLQQFIDDAAAGR